LRVQAPLEELQARMKRLLFTLPFPESPEPPSLPGELARTRSGRDVIVVTGAYTPEREEDLRRTAGLEAVEDMNLEDIFIAIVDGKTGTAPEVAV
jgi:hypothetical protein